MHECNGHSNNEHNDCEVVHKGGPNQAVAHKDTNGVGERWWQESSNGAQGATWRGCDPLQEHTGGLQDQFHCDKVPEHGLIERKSEV